jgi:glycosyltransferase involved in cell wall biosynthesis
MNILYIHHNSEDIGGADFCLHKMVRDVSAIPGYHCHIALSADTESAKAYRDEGIPVTVFPGSILSKNLFELCRYPFECCREVLFFIRLVKQNRIDLVHTNDLTDWSGNLAARWAGIPSVQHIRTILPMGTPAKSILTRLAQRSSTHILCVSEAVRRHMFPSVQKCSVLHDWIDLETAGHTRKRGERGTLRKELGIAEDTLLLGNLGRWVYWKGQHLLIQAAEDIIAHRPDVHICLVGQRSKTNASYSAFLHDLCDRSPVRDHIHFLPFRMDIASLMSQLDLMIHSSVHPDPLPGVVMEAMSQKTVVVAPRAGGIPEMVTHGKTGFLYHPGDPNNLAETVVTALDHIQRDPHMRNRAQAHILKSFNRTKILNHLLERYQSLKLSSRE